MRGSDGKVQLEELKAWRENEDVKLYKLRFVRAGLVLEVDLPEALTKAAAKSGCLSKMCN